MPNRILRDWTDSAVMDKLTAQEEVLFTRLIMKADDYGNFYRNSSLIKSLLFPRKDGLRTSDVDRWLTSLEAADLIRCYPAKGDTFLHVRNFNQRLRQRVRKFPEPPESVISELTADCQQVDRLKRREVEEEVETEEEVEKKVKKKFLPPSLLEFENYFKENGFSKELAGRAWKGYHEAEWHDSRDNPIKNWKQKCQNVWFREENKEKSSAKKERNGNSKNFTTGATATFKPGQDFGEL